jgi:glucose-6-phosphate 1-epimerase
LTATELTDRFGIPDALRFEEAPGGLVRACISTPTDEATLYLQGAHVAHWMPRGQRPVLFLSSRSQFAPGKAIRGGVPLIYPWFGPRGEGQPGPSHGFARTMEWSIESAWLHGSGEVEIALALTANDATRSFGYGDLPLRFRAIAGAELLMELEVRNNGSTPLVYEEALHTYFAIGDIRQASVTGLEGTSYIDKTNGFQRKKLGDSSLRIAQETDQVHLDTRATCVINDPVWNRRIVIEKSGSETTVVWNPWIEKTGAMPDMAPGEWEEMICVETANAADNAVHLPPGASHVLAASICIE